MAFTQDNDGFPNLTVKGSPTAADIVYLADAASGLVPKQATFGSLPFLQLSGGIMTGFLVLSADPVAGLDAATKQYVDAIAAGFSIKEPCLVATTGALTVVYANGAAGVGATLTNADVQAALTIDGVALSVNDRVLVKDQAATLQNGIYTVTDIGSGATNWVMTRATDYDSPSEISMGSLVIITAGTANAVTSWVQVDTVTAVGTDPIQFTQFSAGVGADTALSNLVAVAINTSLLPGTDGTIDLGDATHRFRNALLETIQTGTTNGNTLVLQAYDTGGATYTTFATLTAGATPTMALSGSVTGVTQAAADGSTKLSTTAYADRMVPLAGGTMTGALILNADPTLALGAVTKQYADAISAGLDVKAPVVAASTVALTVVYANGAAGVGATLTNAGAMAAFALDGVSPSVGQRVLIKNQASTFQNGIYTVTVVGSGAVNWVLTRAGDFDQPAEIFPGVLVIVTGGTAQADTSWLETATVATIGTDPITFIQFSTTPLILPLAVTQGGTGVATLTTAYGTLAAGTTATGNVQTIAPGSSGNPLVSAGAGSLPSYTNLLVGGGGTGVQTFTTAYGTVCAGTTATGALQTVSPGSSGNPLVSAGAGALPSYANLTVSGGGTGVATLTTAYGTLAAGTTATGAVQTIATGTTGQVLVSAGNAALPAYGTAPVAGGGTGVSTLTTAYGTLAAGTTATGAVQTIAPGVSGKPLVSAGSSALPAYGTLGVTGGGTGTVAFTAYAVIAAGTTVTGQFQSVTPGTAGLPLVSGGASSLPTYTALTVAAGGTGVTSATAYAVLTGGTTSTGALQSVASVGTSGQVLTSNGAGALPTFQASTGGGKDINTVSGRLTLTTAVPVTTSDVSAAGTLYFTPYKGNSIYLYTASAWTFYTFTEKSIAVASGTNQMYDVFIYDNSGTLTLELLAWTNDTTRATVLATQDGVLCKTGALDRRYLGSIRTKTASQCYDTVSFRHLWNYYNRIPCQMQNTTETTDTWTYTTNAFRQARASTTNQLDFIVGVSEDVVESAVFGSAANTGAAVLVTVGIGLDSTSTNSASLTSAGNTPVASGYVITTANYKGYPGIGRHILTWLEYSGASGTTTWYGDGGAPSQIQNGIFGTTFK